MKKFFVLLLIFFNDYLIGNEVTRLKKIAFVNACNSVSDTFTNAIINKYECPTVPSQLSTFAQAVQLTGPTAVNANTIRRSNNIGRLILKYTNQYRASRGLRALNWDQFAAKVARPHTVAMARGNKPFSHAGFNRRFNWYTSKRPNTQLFGENLLYVLNSNLRTNDQLARFAVNAWRNSPGHERNLTGNFNRMGAAAFRNIHNVWYMTQLLALVV